MNALTLAACNGLLYALRADGAVFVLVQRGTLDPTTLEPASDPHWVQCPAVPGTTHAQEQDG